jgi:hypothetical protein
MNHIKGVHLRGQKVKQEKEPKEAGKEEFPKQRKGFL